MSSNVDVRGWRWNEEEEKGIPPIQASRARTMEALKKLKPREPEWRAFLADSFLPHPRLSVIAYFHAKLNPNLGPLSTLFIFALSTIFDCKYPHLSPLVPLFSQVDHSSHMSIFTDTPTLRIYIIARLVKGINHREPNAPNLQMNPHVNANGGLPSLFLSTQLIVSWY